MQVAPSLNSPAIFSPCRTYRYTLTRDISLFGNSTLVVIGLNPSTADETADDPTIRRCKGFAETWGHSRYIMVNLFAYRATDPTAMLAHPAPIGPENDAAILAAAALTRPRGRILCAWGTHGSHMDRAAYVTALLTNRRHRLHCLGQNADSTPKHPLYIPRTQPPEIYLP